MYPRKIYITANSPGEIAGWLSPVAAAVRRRWPECKISVILLPCPFATGSESKVATDLLHVDEVIPASRYFRVLFSGLKDYKSSVLLHLGGDLMYSAALVWRWRIPAWSYLWGRWWWDSAFKGYFIKECKCSRSVTGGRMLMEDKLLGALIGLAKSTANTAPVESTLETLVDGLALLYTIGNSHKEKENLCAKEAEGELAQMTDRVHEEKFKLVPDCALCQSPCGNTSDYDVSLFRESPASNQKLNLEIIAGLEKIAYSIRQKKSELSLDDDISGLFFRALAVTSFDWAEDDLLELKAEVDKYVLIC